MIRTSAQYQRQRCTWVGIETTRDVYGAVRATDRWKGSFWIALNAPTDERLARINPLGVYVKNASWAKFL